MTAMSATLRGSHGDPDEEELPSVRSILLPMIEETACHSGHVEIGRELLDGRTALGLR
jgi:hypothetical protein